MAKKNVSMKAKVRLSTVVSQLESLLAALKKGRVFVQKGDAWVGLTPPDVLSVEIEAVQTKTKEGLHLELSWRRPNQFEGAAETDSDLKIMETEPVIETSVETTDEDEDEDHDEESEKSSEAGAPDHG